MKQNMRWNKMFVGCRLTAFDLAKGDCCWCLEYLQLALHWIRVLWIVNVSNCRRFFAWESVSLWTPHQMTVDSFSLILFFRFLFLRHKFSSNFFGRKTFHMLKTNQQKYNCFSFFLSIFLFVFISADSRTTWNAFTCKK